MLQEIILNGKEIIDSTSRTMEEYFKISHCILVSSGTVALEVALKALELKRGSKILVPDISFIATASAVANVGYVPVFSDCSLKTWGLSYELVQKAYKQTPDLKGIIVVHFAGIVNRDIKKIAEFCKAKKLFLVEDCAQVFGGTYQGEKCGTFGDVGVYSFQTSKVITCGEGGMVVTFNKELANNVHELIDWGLNLSYARRLTLPCGNYRINALAASYLKEQMQEVGYILNRRIEIYKSILERAIALGKVIYSAGEEATCRDIPFFLLVTSQEPKYYLHPIGEYPMYQSKLVDSILKILYPDLLEVYQECNAGIDHEVSHYMVSNTNFLPMYRVEDEDMEALLRDL